MGVSGDDTASVLRNSGKGKDRNGFREGVHYANWIEVHDLSVGGGRCRGSYRGRTRSRG
jgi:hypothetical protein